MVSVRGTERENLLLKFFILFIFPLPGMAEPAGKGMAQGAGTPRDGVWAPRLLLWGVGNVPTPISTPQLLFFGLENVLTQISTP